MFGKLVSRFLTGESDEQEQAAKPQQDFGSNAAAQEKLKGGGDECEGKLMGIRVAEGGGTEVTVRIGEVPGFNVYWTSIFDGGRRGHYLLDLVEPKQGHGKRTEWDYDGTFVRFVLPYGLDQVKSFGRDFTFKRGLHLVGAAAAASKDGKTLSKASGRIMGLQVAADGRTKVSVGVREGTDGLSMNWRAILDDGRHRVDLTEADATFRGQIASFKVELTADQVQALDREVRFEPL